MTDNVLTADGVLESAKGKMEHVLVVGLTSDGRVHMEMSRPTFEFANYIMNRGIYEVNRMNSEQTIAALQEAALAEQNVREKVAANTKKRGRPAKAA